MRFDELVAGLPGLVRASGKAPINGVKVDSRTVQAGDLFICLPGEKSDGHDFIESAHKAGAAAFVVSRPGAFEALSNSQSVAQVSDCVDACWRVSKRLFGDPASKLQVFGITGTNGKTTTAWLINQMLEELGKRSAYLGTLGARLGGQTIETGLTTPFPPELFALLRQAVDTGNDCFVMEVSSHALSQRRVDGVEFDVAVFTNLTQDHLDFHDTLEEYFAAKSRLFLDLPTSKRSRAVINIDDSFGQKLASRVSGELTVGSAPGAIVRLVQGSCGLDWVAFEFEYLENLYTSKAPVGGRFNIDNGLMAIAALIASGVPTSDAAAALSKVRPAPGRFEPVPTDGKYQVIVDYAHTPDALEKVLASTRELCKGRIIVVFGCGGDRDRTKRPKMAAAASEIADIVYVTSDNPRTESPEGIIAEILPGLRDGTTKRVITDRREAIFAAISEAIADDVVLIAGKGHEDYQIVGTTKTHFDDREVACEAILEKAACV